MGTPRLGKCLRGATAIIRDTKVEDGMSHFMCHDLTDEGKAKHFGFVDRSQAWELENPFGGPPTAASGLVGEIGLHMSKGNSREGYCLCGAPGTIRDTKAVDGRLHFICIFQTPEGKARHYGFVDRSEARLLEEGPPDLWEWDDEEVDSGPCRILSEQEAEERTGLSLTGLTDAEDCTCEKCKEAGKGAFYRPS